MRSAMSQLHSFTAMVFGKDPVEVTDAEVHWFLRFFILIPSIMIAVGVEHPGDGVLHPRRAAPD